MTKHRNNLFYHRWLGFAVAVFAGCSATSETGTMKPTSERAQSPIVYGTDGRTEYFDVDDPSTERLFERSIVVLAPRVLVGPEVDLENAPRLGEQQNLCTGERFTDQPAVAFCTGVLVSAELVLTAGHCLRAYALQDTVALFDYFYEVPGRLATTSQSQRDIIEIVAEELDPVGTTPRLDVAWVRIEPASRNREPIDLSQRAALPFEGQPLHVIGSVSGTPLKDDHSGTVRGPLRPQRDYFSADTDTSHGASGSGAFDVSGRLIGILARGGNDWVSDGGCSRAAEGSQRSAQEEYTYTFRALELLCAGDNYSGSLCDSSSKARGGDALEVGSTGCSLDAGCSYASRPRNMGLVLCLALGAIATRRRATLDAAAGRS